MKKFFGATNLGHVVMLFDTRAKLRLLYSFRGLFLVSLVLAQFVFVLAELKDPANRRVCAGRNLYKIQGMRLGYLKRLVGWHDAQHPSVRTDYTNFTSTNPVVLPYVVTVMIPFSVFSTWFPYHVAI